MPWRLRQQVHELEALFAGERLPDSGELGVDLVFQFTVSHLRNSMGDTSTLVNSSSDYLTTSRGGWQTDGIQVIP